MNNPFGIISSTYTIIINALKKNENIEKAVIFGSRAMGNYKTGSDIDIAISGDNISEKTAVDLSAQLNERSSSPYYFDILVYKNINNKYLKKHIDNEGKVLYSKNNI